jgi:hypothetical protein
MMKTLIEIFEENKTFPIEVGMCALCDTIESRLSALEHPAKQNPVIDALDKAKVRIAKYNSDDRLGEIIDEIKSESTLEHPEPDKQPSAQPAETEREWIPFDGHVWVAWSDGTVNDDIVEDPAPYGASGKATPTHIMPYRKGDKKPEPPKMGGE